jgi:hypothetical protein
MQRKQDINAYVAGCVDDIINSMVYIASASTLEVSTRVMALEVGRTLGLPCFKLKLSFNSSWLPCAKQHLLWREDAHRLHRR